MPSFQVYSKFSQELLLLDITVFSKPQFLYSMLLLLFSNFSRKYKKKIYQEKKRYKVLLPSRKPSYLRLYICPLYKHTY